MAILQGGTYTASVTAAAPLSGAAVALQVTAPDGTSTPFPPASITVSGATATANIPATELGLYLLVWTVAGTYPDMVQDQFTVEAPAPFLLSLSDLKTELLIGDTSKDAKLRFWLRAVTPIVENVTGPLLPRTRTDVFDGGGSAIVLPYRWVQSIQAASETIGQVVYALTEQPLGQTVNQWGYTWDRNTNRIVRRVWGSFDAVFAPGRDNVSFTYTLGMQSIPGDIQRAAAVIIRHWYDSSDIASRPASNFFGQGAGDDAGTMTVGNYEIPNRAMELLEPWRRRPGIF